MAEVYYACSEDGCLQAIVLGHKNDASKSPGTVTTYVLVGRFPTEHRFTRMAFIESPASEGQLLEYGAAPAHALPGLVPGIFAGSKFSPAVVLYLARIFLQRPTRATVKWEDIRGRGGTLLSEVHISWKLA